jgi:hypothetical protein
MNQLTREAREAEVRQASADWKNATREQLEILPSGVVNIVIGYAVEPTVVIMNIMHVDDRLINYRALRIAVRRFDLMSCVICFSNGIGYRPSAIIPDDFVADARNHEMESIWDGPKAFIDESSVSVRCLWYFCLWFTTMINGQRDWSPEVYESVIVGLLRHVEPQTADDREFVRWTNDAARRVLEDYTYRITL